MRSTVTAPFAGRLYRFVASNPPTRDDFRSKEALGVECPDDETLARCWSGISCFATEVQLRSHEKYFHAATAIAVIEVTDECDVRVERTTKSRGHHTVWGEPERILSLVIELIPLR